MSSNPWTTLSSRPIYENPWIAVTEHQVLNAKGAPGIYGTVHFRKLALGVVPLDAEGCTYLVGQHRYPFDSYSWEIPEGGGPLDGDPRQSAARELSEETGLIAADWLEVLRMDLSNSVTDEHAVCFLAWNLTQATAHPDDEEVLQVRRLPFAEALAMVMDGAITDSLSIAALLKLRLMALEGALPEQPRRLILG